MIFTDKHIKEYLSISKSGYFKNKAQDILEKILNGEEAYNKTINLVINKPKDEALNIFKAYKLADNPIFYKRLIQNLISDLNQ